MLQPFVQPEPSVSLERILRELRLMEQQPNHRFYASLVLVVLSIVAAAFLGWRALK